MTHQTGGCLCGAIRYEVTAPPARVTFCHCRFCQRITGGPYAVEPIFSASDMTITKGKPNTYAHRSEGSGMKVYSHFCGTCGAGIYYSFDRWDDVIGIHGGTFDDPNWFTFDESNAKHIFLDVARHDTVIPAGLPTFRQHATTTDGTPCKATVYDAPHPMAEEA